jgi:hypothetical protein
MFRSFWALVVLLTVIPTLCHAKDLCEEFGHMAPLPAWYNDVCDKAGKYKGKIGGAYSTFGDAFNLNPAAIITSHFPVGAEYIRSWSPGSSKNNFALIKGFGHAGAAVTTNSDESFYGNSVFQTPGASTSTTTSTSANTLNNSSFPTLNFGTGLNITSFFATKINQLPLDLTVGLVGKYSKVSGKLTPGVGIGMQLDRFTAGYSYSVDPANGISPEAKYSTITIGWKISSFQIEAVMISNETISPYAGAASTNVNVASFLTASWKIGSFLFTGAFRTYQDVLQVSHTQYHFAAEYVLSPQIALEYLNNYVQDHQSVGLQILF